MVSGWGEQTELQFLIYIIETLKTGPWPGIIVSGQKAFCIMAQ